MFQKAAGGFTPLQVALNEAGKAKSPGKKAEYKEIARYLLEKAKLGDPSTGELEYEAKSEL